MNEFEQSLKFVWRDLLHKHLEAARLGDRKHQTKLLHLLQSLEVEYPIMSTWYNDDPID